MRSLLRFAVLAAVLFGFLGLAFGQSAGVTFTEFKFFSTKGEFDWDKVVYGTKFDMAALFELQVAVDFENPSSKPFNVEIKLFRDGKLLKTEPFNDLKETGGFNGVGIGDSNVAGKVDAGVYKAELWYQGKVVKTAEATVTGTAPKLRVFLNAREFGETGLDVAAIRSAFIRTIDSRSDSGVVFVDSRGDGARELELTVMQDDADDDDDGIADDKDADSDGDGRDDSKENVATIDVDKHLPDATKDLPTENKKTGLIVVLTLTNGRGEVRDVRLLTSGDSFAKDFERFLKEMEVWMFIRVGFME